MDEPRATATAVVVLAALGASLGVGLLVALWVAVRRLARDRAGLALLGLLGAALGWLIWRDLTVLPACGDEIVNLSETLVALVSPVRMTKYPHPSGNFTLSAAAFAVPIVGSAWAAGSDILTATAEWVLLRSTELMVVARVLSSLAWVALAGLCAAIVRRLTGDGWLGLAAAAAAIGPEVTYATALSPYSLGIGLGYAAVAHALWGPRDEAWSARRAAVGGALAGASVGVFYFGVPLAPFALAVGLARPGTRRWPALLAFGGAALVAFLLVNTSALIDFRGHVDMWGYRVRELATFDENAVLAATHDDRASPTFYLRHLAGWSGAWVALLGLVVGAGLAWRRRDLRLALTLALPVLLVVLLSAVATKKQQYVLVAVPGLALAATLWLGPLVARVPWGPVRGALRLAVLVAFATATLAQPLAPQPNGEGALLQRDVVARVFARVKEETPEGARVVIDAPDFSLGHAAQLGLIAPDLVHAAALRARVETGRELVFTCGDGDDCWRGATWLYRVTMQTMEPPRVSTGLHAEPAAAERWGATNLAAFRLLPGAPR